MILSLVYVETGKLDEGVKFCERGVSLGNRHSLLLANLGFVYGKAGRTIESKKLLDELRDLAQKTFVSPMCFAYIHFGLDEIDKAFDWLEKAVDEQDCLLYNIPALSSLDPVRSHPRYKALLRKMNLEP